MGVHCFLCLLFLYVDTSPPKKKIIYIFILKKKKNPLRAILKGMEWILTAEYPYSIERQNYKLYSDIFEYDVQLFFIFSD